MNPGEQLSGKEKAIFKALEVMHDLYEGDGELVRPGAEKHGVQVIQGNVLNKPSKGNYNFRIAEPSVDMVKKLINVKRIAFLCEDYRQFAEVVEEADLHPGEGQDAVFGIAGGTAQPKQERLEALVDLAASLSQANPEVIILAGVHTGVCGGAEHFTGGKMSTLNEVDEKNAMLDYRDVFVDSLLAKGVPSQKIEVGLAEVHGHSFNHWE